jgi:hypothetical protein
MLQPGVVIASQLITYLVGLRKALENAEHEFGTTIRVTRETHAEGVQQHLVEGVREQWFRQLSEVVFEHTWYIQDNWCSTDMLEEAKDGR